MAVAERSSQAVSSGYSVGRGHMTFGFRCTVETNRPETLSDRGGVPLMISEDQLYYWSPIWQQGVRDAAADYAAGDFVEFSGDDTNDIVHHLFDIKSD